MTTDESEWEDDRGPDEDGRHEPCPRRPDHVSLTLTAVTIALVAAATWLRFGPGLFPRPVQIGEPMPPTRLSGLHDDRSRLLLGVEGKVLWLVFVSIETAETPAGLPELETAWNRLRSNRRFGMAVAALDDSGPDRARAALDGFREKLPLYLADRTAPRSFGVDPTGSPWHFLIDPHGRVAAVARGSEKQTIDRLARMAADWLDALAPASDSRFSLVFNAHEHLAPQPSSVGTD